MTFPFLTITIFLPLVGALFILILIRGDEETTSNNARNAALWTSIATFLISLILLVNFDKSTAQFQFVEKHEWIKGYNISYHLGVDGISLFFILLSTFLTPICILASWKSITERVREYMVSFLLLETLMVGVFTALDFTLFYLFFEAVLIPMFLIIGVWGAESRVYAAFKFFLYTLAGSVLLLIALLYIYFTTDTTNILLLMNLVPKFDFNVQYWLWLAMLASFAVKVPMWPVHTWLPDAHVQAPTAGSVILAGVLLKLGAYGFIRFSLPMLPEASAYFAPYIFGFSVVAVVYTSLVALMQEDMKKLIAYSSVAHMGFVTIGIFTFNIQGIEGALFQMLSHGLVSAALFLCVGVLYDRMHTKKIDDYGGVVEPMPRFAFIFLLFTMASIGLPGTSGFVGEILVLVGIFKVNTFVTFLAATGVVLGAAYMLWLVARVVFGPLSRDKIKKLKDLDRREVFMFLPVALLVVLFGVYPNLILDVMHVSVENLVEQIKIQ